MNKLTAAIFGLTSVLATGPAWATPDQLSQPPGVYFGTGNTNAGFTISNTNGVEIGLSAILRYTGPITPTGSTYDVPLGDTTVASQTGPAWGYDYSVNLAGSGLNLSQIFTVLTITDVGLGVSGSYDPRLVNDNADYNGAVCQGTKSTACSPLSSYFAFQNSEPGAYPGFDDTKNDTYLFSLDVFRGVPGSTDTSRLGSDSITVIAGTGASVPEPITLSLFGAGLAGAVAMKRRRKAKA